jgi:hypothetical protein
MFNQSIVQIQFNQLIYFIWLNVVMIIREKLDIRCVLTDGYIESFDWIQISIVIRISNGCSWWLDFN